MTQMLPMTPTHPRWQEFIERLEGPEGCNFRYDELGKGVWDCDAEDHSKPRACAILKAMGMDIVGSMAYFNEHGGYCDCEILFNCVEYRESETDE